MARLEITRSRIVFKNGVKRVIKGDVLIDELTKKFPNQIAEIYNIADGYTIKVGGKFPKNKGVVVKGFYNMGNDHFKLRYSLKKNVELIKL